MWWYSGKLQAAGLGRQSPVGFWRKLFISSCARCWFFQSIARKGDTSKRNSTYKALHGTVSDMICAKKTTKKEKCFILSLLLLLVEHAVMSPNKPKHQPSLHSSVCWFSALFFFLDNLIYFCHSVFRKVPPLPVLQNLQSFLSIRITPQQHLPVLARCGSIRS